MPPGTTTAESPWLKKAPPWAQGRKRPDAAMAVEEVSVESDTSVAEHKLRKLAADTASSVHPLGWEAVVRQARGKSDIADGIWHLPHQAPARLLEHL